jgi:sugar lactone lactonase YvrE
MKTIVFIVMKMNRRNTYIFRLLFCTILVLSFALNQLNAQCVFVSISGPKCTSDGNIIGNFSRNPFQIEWNYEGNVVRTNTAIWTTLATTPVSGNITGSTTQKRVNGTGGIAIDANGTILIADTLNNRVSGFSKTSIDGTVIAGGNGAGSGANQLNKPAGIFLDVFGNLFITDQNNHRIIRYAPGSNTGFVVAGGNGAGSGAGQLNNPKDVFVDASGAVYIADAGNHRIQRWAQGGSVGTTVAGGNGAGSDSIRLNSPVGVCVDQNFNIYVADSANHRIQKFTLGNPRGVTVAGGNGKGSGPQQLNQPVDVVVDAQGNIYILDAGNHRVQRWTANSGSQSTLAGNKDGFGGSLNDQLQSPSAIGFDPSGNLFILDEQNSRVQQYAIIPISTTFAPTYQGTYTATAYSFTGCKQISNSLFILANFPIQVYGNTNACKGDPTFLKITGGGSYTFSPSSSVTKLNDSIYRFTPDITTNYTISSSNSNGCVATNNVTIAIGDKVSPTIKGTAECVAPDAAKLSVKLTGGTPSLLTWNNKNTIEGMSFPSWDNTATSVAGGNGTGNSNAQLNLPAAIAVDTKGNMYVADPINHRIQLWKPGDLVGSTIVGGNGAGNGANQLNYPTGVFIDPLNNLYVVDQNNHRIQYFESGSSSGKTVAGGNGAGSSDFQLNFPSSVIVDGSGNIYVSDAGNHRVQKWSANGKTVNTVAGNGQIGDSSYNLNNPQGLFIDRTGYLYVADAGNHRIMQYYPNSFFGLAVAGNRGVGFDLRQLNNPFAVVADAVGNLYIADKGNNRIQRWVAYDTIGYTIAGSQSGGGGSSPTQLNLPSGLAFNNAGNLLVVDSRNNRVQQFLLNSNSVDTNFSPRKSGTYTAVAYAFSGCASASSNQVIKINSPIKIKATKQAICSGESVSIVAKADSAAAFTWSPSTGLNATNKDSVVATPAITTRYTVSYIDTNNCKANGFVTIKVNATPKVFIEGANCIGAGDLKVNATPKLNYAIWNSINKPANVQINTGWRRSGTTVAGATGVGGVDSSKLGRPNFVFVDEKGALFVCDQWNHRIVKWIQGNRAGVVVAGGRGAGSRLSQLNNPNGIYVDSKGVMYIADTDNDRILKWVQGDTVGVVVAGGNGKGNGPGQLSYPASVYLDGYDNIYIADALNSRIQRWAPGAGVGQTVAGGKSTGSDSTQLNTPLGVFVDGVGNIYVADTQNDRVQRFAPESIKAITVAGGKGRGNNTNQTSLPLNIYVANNKLFITEGGTANRIKSWNIGDAVGEVIVGGATIGSLGDQLNAPGNAMIDANGSLFVSDMNNYRVQRYSLTDTSFAFAANTKDTYRVQGWSFDGCVSNFAIQKMDSGYVPAAPIVANKKYCLNDQSFPLTAGPPSDSLLWYTVGNGGTGSTVAPTPSTTVVGATDYWVSRINALKTCESKREKINVSVNALPGANLRILAKSSLLPGDTAYLQVKPDSLQSINKTLWYRNGNLQTAIPDSTKTLKVFYNNVGSFYVQVNDSNFCRSTSNTVEIKAEIAQQQSMYVFPNPVKDLTRIIFATIPNNTIYLKIISSNGVVLSNQKIPTSAVGNTVYDLDLSNYIPGTYDIQVYSGTGKIIDTKRVIRL